MEEKIEFGIGVLIFNPLDDEFHLERINRCVSSLIRTIDYCSDIKTKLILLMNESFVPSINKTGIGPNTKEMVEDLVTKGNIDCEIVFHSYKNSMNVKGYNFLLKKMAKEISPY